MWLERLFKKRRKVEFGISQAMPDKELIEKFAYPGHPLLDGMMCVLDKHFAELVNQSMDAETKDKESKAVAGMEALMAYKADVEDYLLEAMRKTEGGDSEKE